MKIKLDRVNKNGYHFIKCENNNKKRKKLGSYSRYQYNGYIRLDLPRFYHYIRGGAVFERTKAYIKKLGEFNLCEALYLYEKGKDKREIKIYKGKSRGKGR